MLQLLAELGTSISIHVSGVNFIVVDMCLFVSMGEDEIMDYDEY